MEAGYGTIDVVDRPADPVPIHGLSLENVTVHKFTSAGRCTFAQLSTSGTIAPAIPVGKMCNITQQQTMAV